MEDTLKKKLVESGIDVDGAMERFMNNDTMFKKFLLKFLDDPNMRLLRQGLEAHDTDMAFRAAHTLKGVCGNLSLVSLAKVASEATEYLRAGDIDSAIARMPEVEEEYAKAIEVIKNI